MAGRDPGGGLVGKRHAQGQALPLHSPSQHAVGPPEDAVALQKQARANGIGKCRHAGGPALEAGQGILNMEWLNWA